MSVPHTESFPSHLGGGKFAERSEGKQGGGKQCHPTRLLASKSALADLDIYKMPISDKSEMGARNHPPRQGEGEERCRDCAYTKSLRTISSSLALWRLCRRAACFRAKACQGPPRQCLEECSPLVPLAAREFVINALNDKQNGYSPEEAVRDHPQEAEAFFEWREAAGVRQG
jgi:hypothetical protein